MGRWWSVLSLSLLASCVESKLVDCGNGLLCPVGSICVNGGCASIGDCGNGLLDPLEACDDGNRVGGDGCNATCTSNEACGNGVTDFGEACDCGSDTQPGGPLCQDTLNGGALCRNDCTLPQCGNGDVDGLEMCDDGNATNGDGCSATCASNETCGNSVIDVAIGEQCDDGNLDDHDGCQSTCVIQRCGDGIIDTGEVCDDGNLVSGDGCAPDCASDETCGNGTIDFFAGERCDDGNKRSHDGCHSRCVLETPAWIQVGPEPLITRPSTLAYDSQRERVVLYLGSDTPTQISETYELLDTGWVRANPISSPPWRSMSSIAYDAARGEVVMFGGIEGAGYTAETWTYDGSTWRIREPQLSPSARAGVALAYDPIRQRVVMQGGTDENGYQGDTWEWDGSSWTQTVGQVLALASEAEGAMAYDLANNRMRRLDGGELWEYDGASWTQLTAVANVSASMITFDLVRNKLVATGGANTYELVGSTWTPIAGASPPGRFRSGIAYDARRREVVVHGGQNRSDTWRHDGTAWSELLPSLRPPPLYGMGMTYDNVRDRVVVFGGAYTAASGISNETWEFDGAVWTKRQPVDSPPALYGTQMAYDVARKETVLFGGRDASFARRAETWHWNGTNWSTFGTTDAPSGRYLSAMTYDTDLERCVLVSGLASAGAPNDTWAFVNDNWVSLPATMAVPGHYDHALAYDEAGHRTILFGGYNNGPVGDTWAYANGTWTQLGQPVSPLDYPAAAYLAARKRVVRVGGYYNKNAHELDGTVWKVGAAMPTDRAEHRAAGDPLRDRIVVFGGIAETGPPYTPDDLYAYTYRAPVPDEYCAGGADRDGDGLAGCADPDCAAACNPMCPPLANCPVDAVRCGDGTCGTQESKRLCPADCGAVTPLCGDGWCDAPENATSCNADC